MAVNRRGEVVRAGDYSGRNNHGARSRRPLSIYFDGDNYSEEELAFMKWIDAKKREENNYHPNWPTVLRWAKEFGLRKVCTTVTPDGTQ